MSGSPGLGQGAAAAAAAAAADDRTTAATPRPPFRVYRKLGKELLETRSVAIIENSPLAHSVVEIFQGDSRRQRLARMWLTMLRPEKASASQETAWLAMVIQSFAIIMSTLLAACPKELTDKTDMNDPNLLIVQMSTNIMVVDRSGGGKDGLLRVPRLMLGTVLDGVGDASGGHDACAATQLLVDPDLNRLSENLNGRTPGSAMVLTEGTPFLAKILSRTSASAKAGALRQWVAQCTCARIGSNYDSLRPMQKAPFSMQRHGSVIIVVQKDGAILKMTGDGPDEIGGAIAGYAKSTSAHAASDMGASTRLPILLVGGETAVHTATDPRNDQTGGGMMKLAPHLAAGSPRKQASAAAPSPREAARGRAGSGASGPRRNLETPEVLESENPDQSELGTLGVSTPTVAKLAFAIVLHAAYNRHVRIANWADSDAVSAAIGSGQTFKSTFLDETVRIGDGHLQSTVQRIASETFTVLTHGTNLLMLTLETLHKKAEERKLDEFCACIEENWRNDTEKLFAGVSDGALGLLGIEVRATAANAEGVVNVLGARADAVGAATDITLAIAEGTLALKRCETFDSIKEVKNCAVDDGTTAAGSSAATSTPANRGDAAAASDGVHQANNAATWLPPSDRYADANPGAPRLTPEQAGHALLSFVMSSDAPVTRVSAVTPTYPGSQSKKKKADAVSFTGLEGKKRSLFMVDEFAEASKRAGMELVTEMPHLSETLAELAGGALFSANYAMPSNSQLLVWLVQCNPDMTALPDADRKIVSKLRRARLQELFATYWGPARAPQLMREYKAILKASSKRKEELKGEHKEMAEQVKSGRCKCAKQLGVAHKCGLDITSMPLVPGFHADNNKADDSDDSSDDGNLWDGFVEVAAATALAAEEGDDEPPPDPPPLKSPSPTRKSAGSDIENAGGSGSESGGGSAASGETQAAEAVQTAHKAAQERAKNLQAAAAQAQAEADAHRQASVEQSQLANAAQLAVDALSQVPAGSATKHLAAGGGAAAATTPRGPPVTPTMGGGLMNAAAGTNLGGGGVGSRSGSHGAATHTAPALMAAGGGGAMETTAPPQNNDGQTYGGGGGGGGSMGPAPFTAPGGGSFGSPEWVFSNLGSATLRSIGWKVFSSGNRLAYARPGAPLGVEDNPGPSQRFTTKYYGVISHSHYIEDDLENPTVGPLNIAYFGSAAKFLVCSSVATFLQDAGITSVAKLISEVHGCAQVQPGTKRGKAAQEMANSPPKRTRKK